MSARTARRAREINDHQLPPARLPAQPSCQRPTAFPAGALRPIADRSDSDEQQHGNQGCS